MDKKIFFLDLDGTTLRDDKSIPEVNITAIHEALKNGHAVAIASGRPLVTAQRIAKRLDMMRKGCYLISFNGAMICDLGNGRILSDRRMPDEYAVYLLSEAKREGVYMHAYDEEYFLTEQLCPESEFYKKTTGTPCRVVPDLFDLTSLNTPKLLSVSLSGHEPLLRFQQEHLAWAEGKCVGFFSSPEVLEYCYYKAIKEQGISFLETYLGIAHENTIAVGDAENDLSMIRSAGIGVAMNNASEEVREQADYVTTLDNNEGGVAEVLIKFG
ncbi:MAG: Cof-type HAD-IIB family hydrolase [Lachnospiraceae bacterium]|nr:Cof-type HAD-IIB family hydrolase [Lachnospiraceae bacterium]